MGFQSPTSGSATVLGADVTDADALREARSRVGYLPSEPGFDERVTGRRLLEYHGAFLLDTIASGADIEWLGAVSPTRYYDPLAVLTASEYELAGAAVLLAATVVLLLAAIAWFREVDLP